MIVCGWSVAIGLGINYVTALLEQIFGLKVSMASNLGVILAWTALPTLTIYFGLKKGMKILSDVRFILGFGTLLILAIVGPTSFMFNNFVDSVGTQFNNLIRMTLYTDPFKSGKWFRTRMDNFLYCMGISL